MRGRRLSLGPIIEGGPGDFKWDDKASGEDWYAKSMRDKDVKSFAKLFDTGGVKGVEAGSADMQEVLMPTEIPTLSSNDKNWIKGAASENKKGCLAIPKGDDKLYIKMAKQWCELEYMPKKIRGVNIGWCQGFNVYKHKGDDNGPKCNFDTGRCNEICFREDMGKKAKRKNNKNKDNVHSHLIKGKEKPRLCRSVSEIVECIRKNGHCQCRLDPKKNKSVCVEVLRALMLRGHSNGASAKKIKKEDQARKYWVYINAGKKLSKGKSDLEKFRWKCSSGYHGKTCDANFVSFHALKGKAQTSVLTAFVDELAKKEPNSATYDLDEHGAFMSAAGLDGETEIQHAANSIVSTVVDIGATAGTELVINAAFQAFQLGRWGAKAMTKVAGGGLDAIAGLIADRAVAANPWMKCTSAKCMGDAFRKGVDDSAQDTAKHSFMSQYATAVYDYLVFSYKAAGILSGIGRNRLHDMNEFQQAKTACAAMTNCGGWVGDFEHGICDDGWGADSQRARECHAVGQTIKRNATCSLLRQVIPEIELLESTGKSLGNLRGMIPKTKAYYDNLVKFRDDNPLGMCTHCTESSIFGDPIPIKEQVPWGYSNSCPTKADPDVVTRKAANLPDIRVWAERECDDWEGGKWEGKNKDKWSKC